MLYNPEIIQQSFSKNGKYFNLKRRKVEITELFRFIKKQTVLDLCKQCPNFNMIWSCPTEVPDFEQFSQNYRNAELILMWSDTKQFELEENPTLASYEFLKKRSYTYVMEQEKELNGVAVLSFSCNLCKLCSKVNNTPCIKPDLMRFNLTAFGFLIDTIANELMDHQLSWNKDQNEAEYITQVSLVLYK